MVLYLIIAAFILSAVGVMAAYLFLDIVILICLGGKR